MEKLSITQIVLVVGLLGITFCLFFAVVPPENTRLFETCLTAIISFISGTAIGMTLGKGSRDEKLSTPDPPGPVGQ